MSRPEFSFGATQEKEHLHFKAVQFVGNLPIANSPGVNDVNMPEIIKAFESGDRLPKDIFLRHTSGLLINPETMEKASRAFLKEYYEAEIEQLNFSVRVYNVLRRRGIETVGQILENGSAELNNQDISTLKRSGRKRRKVVGLGKASMTELMDNLKEHGIWPFNQSQIEKSFSGYDELTFRYGNIPRDFNWDAYKDLQSKGA